ncbi:MAG: SDR family oxidoreductase [Verrucomicrobiota bacterium]
MKKVWITGAGGLLGNYLVQTASTFAPDWKVFGLTRSQLDLTDDKSVREKFQRDQPDFIIHCAAQSKVPACQSDPELAWKLNVDVTTALTKIAQNIPFIFFSTDLVFDGLKGNYVETDATNPVTVYGETKVAAEKIVLQNPRHTVIRTSMNCGISPTGDRGFSDELFRSWKNGETTNLFLDEFRCPMFAAITARAIWELAAKNVSGIFHLAGSERLSRADIGKLVASHFPELNPKIKTGSVKDFHGPRRAPDTSVNCAKVQKLLSFPLPAFSEWIGIHSAELFREKNSRNSGG